MFSVLFLMFLALDTFYYEILIFLGMRVNARQIFSSHRALNANVRGLWRTEGVCRQGCLYPSSLVSTHTCRMPCYLLRAPYDILSDLTSSEMCQTAELPLLPSTPPYLSEPCTPTMQLSPVLRNCSDTEPPLDSIHQLI